MNEEFDNNVTNQNNNAESNSSPVSGENSTNSEAVGQRISQNDNNNSNVSQGNEQSYNNSGNVSQRNEQSYTNSDNVSQGSENNYHSNSAGAFNITGDTNPMNMQTNTGNPYTVYPTPEVNGEKKLKKKGKASGVFKLTAAAIAFGLIAGTAFQGFYWVMNLSGKSVDIANDKDVKVAQVSEDTNSSDTIGPTSTNSGDTVATDVSDIVNKVMPAIVAINANVTTTSYDFFGREVAQEGQSSGSGIIIAQNDSTLLIVTNNHVIDGATSVEIVFADDNKASAVIKGADANSDLAILSVNIKGLSPETIAAIEVARLGDSSTVEAGDMAIAIGNALGYGQSVTVGYISAVNREVTIDDNTMTLLQTDAAINPGNSGGALLNSEGKVIGINSVKYADTEVEGMGYSIPISSARPMIDELMHRETVSASEQGYLGVDPKAAQNVTADYAKRFNMPVGIYINDVIKGSPAAKAGLVQGDIITGVNDVKVETVEELKDALSYKKAGQEIQLKIQTKENGAYVEKSLTVTLGGKN